MTTPDHCLTAADLATLAASLDRAITDMARLAELMLDELRVLEAHEVEHLQRIINDKQRLTTRLATETQHQQRWIEAAGFSFTPAGVEQFIQTYADAEAFGARWATLLDHTRRCSQLNGQNARTVERHWRRATATLRLLQGEDASTTYDPRGRTARGQRGRTISQA